MNSVEPVKTEKVTSGEGRGELIEVRFLRTETALKEFPMHVLDDRAKRDEIVVVKDGEVVWRVMFRAKEGIPRDLAYRVERLVIDAAIDQAMRIGSPPAVVKLGTLREICASMGMNGSGANTRNVRNALLQIAGTEIDVSGAADVRWRKYQWISFTGEKRRDGTRSDAIYLGLSDPFREILSTSPRRPLDYDYINQLPAAAARFYEIIAPRIFGALSAAKRAREKLSANETTKDQALGVVENAVARIAYSDICNSIGIVRYPDRTRMTKQLYKLHRPHICNRYIEKVEYRERRSGGADWMVSYTPGSKAVQEFEVAMKGGMEAPVQATVIPFPVSSIIIGCSPQTENSACADPVSISAPSNQNTNELAERLVSLGVSVSSAAKLANENEEYTRLWLEVYEAGHCPKNVRDRAAYIVKMISERVPSPSYSKEKTNRSETKRISQLEVPKEAASCEELKGLQNYLGTLSSDELKAFDESVLALLPSYVLTTLDKFGEKWRDKTLQQYRLEYWKGHIKQQA